MSQTEINSQYRVLSINDPASNNEFPTNYVKTSKYTLLNFIPKSLFAQFLRLANFYFLICAVVQSIPGVSPISPVTSIIPLVFVLVTSMIREALEDYRRYRNDKVTNYQITHKYAPDGNSHFQDLTWDKVRVGDIIKVEKDEIFPADLIMFYSSDIHGIAYVETASLDGERNLKQKQSIEELLVAAKTQGLEAVKGKAEVEKPNNNIHQFEGKVQLTGEAFVNLTNDNILLRGTVLKNTDFVMGVVIYTGHDTKVMRNQGAIKYKQSDIEKKVNRIVVFILILQIALCAIGSFCSLNYWLTNYADGASVSPWYLYDRNGHGPQWDFSNAGFWFITFITYFILLNTLIPISLVVSVEVIKALQAIWMEWDDLFKDSELKMPLKVQNLVIHEELGRIEYIFSDKTGTLTSNNMVFHKCLIYNQIFGPEQLEDVEEMKSLIARDEMTREFWLCLAICHDVLVDLSKGEGENGQPIVYQGASPDEVSLVSKTSKMGVVFRKKTKDQLFLDLLDTNKEYDLLRRIDFTSERKRMSVVVREAGSNMVTVYVKGADMTVLPLLHQGSDPVHTAMVKKQIKLFAKEGLRTLLIAKKEMTNESFNNWLECVRKAGESAPTADLPDLIKAFETELENGLTLLGITAVEDKLQVGVPETIQAIHAADIKVWMLTGDKLETAENIGYSTHLLDNYTKVFRLKGDTYEACRDTFKSFLPKIQQIKEGQEVSIDMERQSSYREIGGEIMLRKQKFKYFALIIEGDSIGHMIEHPDLSSQFIKLIPEFRTVICCRSTPNQKAEVVKFVRTNLNRVTLAIGDGGNDVSMIQLADVGIGILGKEGNQAANAADYGITQFRYLWRLLFVHGRWNYYRMAYYVYYFLYKNLVFTLPQFWFMIFSAYSAVSIWESIYLALFNTIMTAVSSGCWGACEQDINPKDGVLIAKYSPALYKMNRERRLFTYKEFMVWYINGIWHSLVVFFIAYFSYDAIVNSDGLTDGFWAYSTCAYFACVFVVTGRLFLMTDNWTWFVIICYFPLSLLAFFPSFVLVYDLVPANNFARMIYDFLGTPVFWLANLVILGVCLIPTYFIRNYQRVFHPTILEILRYLQKHGLVGDTKYNLLDSSQDKINEVHPESDGSRRSSFVHVGNIEDFVPTEKDHSQSKLEIHQTAPFRNFSQNTTMVQPIQIMRRAPVEIVPVPSQYSTNFTMVPVLQAVQSSANKKEDL